MELFLAVDDALSADAERAFGLGQRRTVIDLDHARVTSTFSEREPSGGRVSHYIATNRLLGVRREHGRAWHVCHHLICNHDRYTKLKTNN